MIITADRLRELLSYSPETGVFTWRVDRGGKARAGTVAGNKAQGWINIGVDGRPYRAGHLAVLYMTGHRPVGSVVPIDGDPFNLVWENLRYVPRSTAPARCRRANQQSAPKRGETGVYRKPNGQFYASIEVHGECLWYDTFNTAGAAWAAYQQAARKHLGEHAREA